MGVLVVGMHRSGTSAVTRVVNLVGVPISGERDLNAASRSNPRGHWENRPLLRVNERILNAFGGSWSAPPEFPVHWEDSPCLQNLQSPAIRTFRNTVPSPKWVWKDPRLCLTLPFWRKHLPDLTGAVFVTRHPFEVAESLATRNDFSMALSMSLWEHHLRSALVNLTGLPVTVVNFARFLDDPVAWARELREELLLSEVKPGTDVDEHAIRDFVDPRLRRAVHADSHLPRLDCVSESHRALYDAMTRLEGYHESFVGPELPPPASWSLAILQERRAVFPLRAELRAARRRSLRYWWRRLSSAGLRRLRSVTRSGGEPR